MREGTSPLKIFRDGVAWSFDQENAIEKINNWRTAWPAANQFFTVGGLAGTGKTTLIAEIVQGWKGVAVACPTGKAANVLRQKGISASTIHSLIYRPWEDELGEVHFGRVPKLDGIKTLVIDEASMVDQWLMNDLLSYSLPVLFVGDHGQLEPVVKNPHLMKSPDVKLERIHRQAQDNPIIRLAAAFREGRDVPFWKDKNGRCTITRKRDFQSYVNSGMQLICGFNKTRHLLNTQLRKSLGFSGPTPCDGEKLICLRNNKKFEIFNGQQAVCIEARNSRRGKVELRIELDDGRTIAVACLVDQFGAETIKEHKDEDVLLFDYGYCLTAHKSQGSEYEGVVAIEEISNAWNAARWRYTTVTRAKERLVYCM
jgi:exodeoxyribonuclease-5